MAVDTPGIVCGNEQELGKRGSGSMQLEAMEVVDEDGIAEGSASFRAPSHES